MSSNIEGVATALVTANRDPEGLCRVQVSYPWHETPDARHWARLCTFMAGKASGAVFIPDIGDEVLVAFERGDVRRPYVLGALWSSQAPPPSTNASASERRLICSRKGHTLLFDDGTPTGVRLATGDGRKVVFDDNGVAVQDAKGNRLRIDSSGGVEIVTAGKLTIKAAAVSIESTAALDVKSGATLSLRGALVNIN